RRRGRRSARAHARSDRRPDSRGALREPLPLHGLRQDLRRRPRGGRAVSVQLELGRVGEIVPRADGVPKVTGEFAYSSDFQAAGMLWGHTLRSPHAHARITGIDASAAVGVPGVHAVLTREDVPGAKLYGLEFKAQPVLAIDRVRYFGERVALVAAEHPEQARRAAELIRIDYEPLPQIADAETATEREALHPERP